MLDLVVSAAFAVPLLSAGPVPASPEDRHFSADSIRAHLEFLADDRLEGRGTGTRGFDLAAHYVATQFHAAGLVPAAPAGWYQPAPLVERTPNVAPEPRLTIGERRFPLGEHALAAISGEGVQTWSGGAVFVGYGLADPDLGIDDYRGLDVRGKAVLYYDAAPGSLTPDQADRLSQARGEAARARGAAGLVPIRPGDAADGMTWGDWRSAFAQPFFNWLQDDGEPYRPVPMRFSAMLDSVAAAHALDGALVDFAGIEALAARGEPLPAFPLASRMTIESENRWRRFSSPNVVGMVSGTDRAVARECILVTSHLDHLGVDASVAGDDGIFNGALDNASGVAVMIEMARAMAAVRPRRPVLFVATTGEELGLLGSDYLAAQGLPVCDRVAGVVNIDGGIPLHDLPEAVAYGGWHSTIGPAFEAVAAANGIRAGRDDMPPTQIFDRTDHFSFVRRGVPAVYLVMSSGGDEEAQARYRGRYHQPNDDLTLPFNWEAGARFARLAHDLVRALADGPETRWYADSPIGQRYAPDEPKATRP
ncbi:M28 family peptidase [Brevundimonas sp.]|uniref:M28 family peptidase n=1 Tax=Brevundimonas sp. TaxID=1871086 RepID=UPI002FCC91DE